MAWLEPRFKFESHSAQFVVQTVTLQLTFFPQCGSKLAKNLSVKARLDWQQNYILSVNLGHFMLLGSKNLD